MAFFVGTKLIVIKNYLVYIQVITYNLLLTK